MDKNRMISYGDAIYEACAEEMKKGSEKENIFFDFRVKASFLVESSFLPKKHVNLHAKRASVLPFGVSFLAESIILKDNMWAFSMGV